MALVREKKIAGRSFVLKEKTVREIRDHIAASVAGDMVDYGLFEDVSILDLRFLADLSAEDVDGMTPSELEEILGEVKEVNQRFFPMLQRQMEAFRRLAMELTVPASLSAPSPN